MFYLINKTSVFSHSILELLFSKINLLLLEKNKSCDSETTFELCLMFDFLVM